MKRSLAIFVLALGVSSCGSGEDGPSKAGFISQADALCHRFNNQFNRAQNQIIRSLGLPPGAANDAALSKLIDQQTAVISDELAALSELDVPSGDEAPVQRFLDGLSEEQRLNEELSNAALGSDFERFDFLQEQYGQVDTRTRGIATGYGFKTCK